MLFRNGYTYSGSLYCRLTISFFFFSPLNKFLFSFFLSMLTFHIFPTISSPSPPKFLGCFFLSFILPHVYNFLLNTSFLPNLYSLSSFLSKMSFLIFHLFILTVFLFSLQPIFLLEHIQDWEEKQKLLKACLRQKGVVFCTHMKSH